MRLDKVMTRLLVKINPKFEEFVSEDGSSILQLNKALYGCVKAVHLWYLMLREKSRSKRIRSEPRRTMRLQQAQHCWNTDFADTSCKSEAEIDLFFAYLFCAHNFQL